MQVFSITATCIQRPEICGPKVTIIDRFHCISNYPPNTWKNATSETVARKRLLPIITDCRHGSWSLATLLISLSLTNEPVWLQKAMHICLRGSQHYTFNKLS